MKTAILLITSILSTFLININIYAQSPTTDEKIQGIRDKVEEKVQEKLENIITEDKKKSWAGKITEKSQTNFKITTNNSQRTVSLNEELTIINQNRQEITFEDLEQEQYVLAMGYEKIDGTLNAHRIVVTDEYQPTDRTSVHGSIVNKAEKEKIVLIQNSEKEYELILNTTTELNQKVEQNIEEIDYEDLQKDQEVVVIVKPAEGETETYQALEILVLGSK